MARFMNPTPEQETAWLEWVATRPEAVRSVVRRFEPWSLYRLKTTGHRVIVRAVGETEDDDGNVTIDLRVLISGEFNLLVFDREVFGINPDDLEPCELPGEDEEVGTALPDEMVPGYIESIRPEVMRYRNYENN
jgi:hypothetical protein